MKAIIGKPQLWQMILIYERQVFGPDRKNIEKIYDPGSQNSV